MKMSLRNTFQPLAPLAGFEPNSLEGLFLHQRQALEKKDSSNL
jgi:hypothetical protein